MSTLCRILGRFPPVYLNFKQNARTLCNPKLLRQESLSYSTNFKTVEDEGPKHTIIDDNERSCGPKIKVGFQAETQKLLDIVAKSLYSDKEVSGKYNSMLMITYQFSKFKAFQEVST